MNNYELMKNSILKNLEELTEFCVDEFNITNYYDLTDFMIDLFNFKVITKNFHNNTYKKVIKHLEDINKEVNNNE